MQMEKNDEMNTFAEWWDLLERDGTKLAGAAFFEASKGTKKLMTFEEFADLCVKTLDTESKMRNESVAVVRRDYFKDLIQRELVHIGLCKLIERIKDQRTAIDFHEAYVEIERSKGLNEAIEFQWTKAKEFQLIPPDEITIKAKGDKIILTISNVDLLEPTDGKENDMDTGRKERPKGGGPA